MWRIRHASAPNSTIRAMSHSPARPARQPVKLDGCQQRKARKQRVLRRREREIAKQREYAIVEGGGDQRAPVRAPGIHGRQSVADGKAHDRRL